MTNLTVLDKDVSTLFFRIRQSTWLIPGLLVLAAVILAPTMVYLDERYGKAAQEWLPFVFGGGPEGARQMLATIATAMASVIGIAFSIVIVVLQLAASQYSPRVITTFRRDRGQQVVLGMYLATFVYSLMVLRQVRAPNGVDEGLVPGLAMLIALILSLTCLGLLLYFVHHVSEQLRVSNITTRIRADLTEASESLYPQDVGEPCDRSTPDEGLIADIEEQARDSVIVRSPDAGYLRSFRESKLAEYIEEPVLAIRVESPYGSFVFQHEVMATIFLSGSPQSIDDERFSGLAQECFSIGSTPPLRSNAQLAVQQLVDVALRALSTGVNDPSTARQVLEELSDWLALTAHREFPSRVRCIDGRVLILPQTSFDDYVHQVFGQIRESSSIGASLLHTIAEMLEKLLETDPPKARLRVFSDQLLVLKKDTDKIVNPIERKRLVERVDTILEDVNIRTAEQWSGR